MKPTKIIFSLNTYPITNNRWNMGNKLINTIYMTGLSIQYATKWYAEVELYIDNVGFAFFKDFPCKVIKMDFENDAELWMKSKIEVIQKQTSPFIHVDNDVFFKKNIDLSFNSVIVERIDHAYYNYSSLVRFFNNYANELDYWNPDLKLIPCCGVIGFAKMDLKNAFVTAFYSFEKTFKKYHIAYDSYLKEMGGPGNYQEPCLVLEQFNLGCLLNDKSIIPEKIIEGNNEIEQSQFANKIGYTHLYGSSKYDPKTIKRIHFLFETEFPNQYKELSKKVKTYSTSTLIVNAV